VGKSCLLVRFADDCFSENYITTIGVDFRFRTLQINKSNIKLQIWDTAGQERYRTITNAYYKGADGIIIVFDLCNKESFLNVSSWLKEVEKHSGEDVTVTVLANKSDSQAEELEVTDADIKKFEEESGIKVIKTSAKTGENVDESFLDMTKKLIIKRNSSTQEEKKKTIGLKKLKETIDAGNGDRSANPGASGNSNSSMCCQ
jgi:Ras-related protein Rab-1A